jgi:serine/threonine protein kinase
MTDFYYRNVDTWSLGILAFLLLFDILPFDINNDEDDIDSVKQKIVQNKFKFPYNRIDKIELDIKIRKFIMKCLVKDKNKRPRISEIEYI